jgi:hypothetical protein
MSYRWRTEMAIPQPRRAAPTPNRPVARRLLRPLRRKVKVERALAGEPADAAAGKPVPDRGCTH